MKIKVLPHNHFVNKKLWLHTQSIKPFLEKKPVLQLILQYNHTSYLFAFGIWPQSLI